MNAFVVVRNGPLVCCRLALLLATIVAASLASPAAACSVCGCGDPLLAASDPAAINGQLRLDLATEYLAVDAGTDGQPGFTDKLTQWSYRFNVVYRPLDAVAVTATVPLVTKSIRTVGGGAETTASNLTGLGDVEVGARYAVWTRIDFAARRVQELAFSAGTSIPTGSYNSRAPDGGLIDPHGQLGTGGWGPFAGAHYRFEQGDWTGFASLSYRLRTEATYFDATRYKFGDALLWSVHGQYKVSSRLALDLGIDGRYAKTDRAVDGDGVVTDAVANTGGTVLAAAPGVYLNAFGNVWLYARGQVPFYKNLFGEQDVKPSFMTGVQLLAF